MGRKGDPKSLTEVFSEGFVEEEELENSGFSDLEANEVAEPADDNQLDTTDPDGIEPAEASVPKPPTPKLPSVRVSNTVRRRRPARA